MPSIYIPDINVMNFSKFITGSVRGSEISLENGNLLLIMFARQIIKEELDYVEKHNHEVDLVRIQELLDGDHEMRDLGYLALQEYTTYTVPLLRAIQSHSFYQIENLISEYTEYCKGGPLLRPQKLWRTIKDQQI